MDGSREAERGVALDERFEVVRELGRGGFGRVLLARDRGLDRQVAMKVLHHRFPDPACLRRFRREARITAALRHPGVVELYDFGQLASGDLYILYEAIDGLDLRRLLAGDEPLTVREIMEMASQVGAALAAAHRAGVTHRDVKPENILRRRDGRWVLCDFGIARPSEASRELTGGGILGTPQYIAPEIWCGAAPGPAADQFALAATLFELFFGAPVYGTGSLSGILAAVRERRPVAFPPGRAARDWELERVLQRALERDPTARFPDMDAFVEALPTGARDLGGEPRAGSRARGPATVERRATLALPHPRLGARVPDFKGAALVAGALALWGLGTNLLGCSPMITTAPRSSPPAAGRSRDSTVALALRRAYQEVAVGHRDASGHLSVGPRTGTLQTHVLASAGGYLAGDFPARWGRLATALAQVLEELRRGREGEAAAGPFPADQAARELLEEVGLRFMGHVAQDLKYLDFHLQHLPTLGRSQELRDLPLPLGESLERVRTVLADARAATRPLVHRLDGWPAPVPPMVRALRIRLGALLDPDAAGLRHLHAGLAQLRLGADDREAGWLASALLDHTGSMVWSHETEDRLRERLLPAVLARLDTGWSGLAPERRLELEMLTALEGLRAAWLRPERPRPGLAVFDRLAPRLVSAGRTDPAGLRQALDQTLGLYGLFNPSFQEVRLRPEFAARLARLSTLRESLEGPMEAARPLAPGQEALASWLVTPLS